jgi:hypothetical protein
MHQAIAVFGILAMGLFVFKPQFERICAHYRNVIGW